MPVLDSTWIITCFCGWNYVYKAVSKSRSGPWNFTGRRGQTRLILQFYLSFKKYSCVSKTGNSLASRLNLAGTPGPATANRECLKNGSPNHTPILKPFLPRGVATDASQPSLRVTSCEATPVPEFVTPDLSATRHFVSVPCDHSIGSSSFSLFHSVYAVWGLRPSGLLCCRYR